MLSTIEIWGITIPMRSLMINIGMVTGIAVLLYILFRNIEKEKIIRLIIVYIITLFTAAIGSRIVAILMYYDSGESLWNNIINSEGANFSGYVLGYIIIFAVLYIIIIGDMLKFWEDIKPSVFYLSIQLCFNRIGCLMAGCCSGIEYSGPFAIHYSSTSLGVFPTQPMESLSMILVLILSIKFYKSKRVNIFCLFMVIFGLITILSEALMDNYTDTRIWGITIPQLICIALVIGGIIINNKIRKGEEG